MTSSMNQRGVTLVETLLAAAISTMVVGLLASAIFLCLRVTQEGNGELTVLHDVQNAGHWFTRDAQSAQSTDLVPGADPVDSLTLSWNDEGEDHAVRYFLSESDLRRDMDGTETTVARHVSSVGFSISNEGALAATLSSSTEGRWKASKDALYIASPRPAG